MSVSPERPKDPLDLIADMTREFTTSQDAEQTMHHGLRQVAELLHAEAASLFLLENGDKDLVCRACHGPVDITGLRLPPDHGIVGRTVMENRSQLVRDVSDDPDFGGQVDEKTGFTTRSILCAPLTVREHHLGVVEIINKQDGDGLFNMEDMRVLATLARSAALALLNARLTEQLLERERLVRELELAAEIQRGLLPVPDPDDAPVHGINIAAHDVSGDFFDILLDPKGRRWFCVGDVSGKGMNAALMMAKTASLFRCLAKSMPSPGALMDTLNAELCETASRGMFVTMVSGMIVEDGSRVLLSNAGHEPVQVFHRSADRFEAIPAEVPPLGIFPDIAGPGGFPESDLSLAGKDLYIFTDGVTEAKTKDGTMVGVERIKDMLRAGRALPPSQQLAKIAETLLAEDIKQRDDITLLIVRGPDDLRTKGSTA
ncbi:PP2C family protein-serine/threonine phosphatase [Rhodospirillum sp. A1_3_36]|uniref:PP2C family protein-serine/threonine phosphatase n=1 Tax=Rhodospirillum sp. A1_3_36 TaxID=3391666 RepID=UPI0039A49EE9